MILLYLNEVNAAFLSSHGELPSQFPPWKKLLPLLNLSPDLLKGVG